MKIITGSQAEKIFEEEKIKNSDFDRNKLEFFLVEKLLKSKKKIATAESCTGGLLSQRITNVSGASNVFDCGVCSYSNEIKNKILGVKNETLQTVGAVSCETAIQMANGVRNLANADIGLSTTGIAGPTGGTFEKPVGLVYVGISTKEKSYALKLLLCDENSNFKTRNDIRKATSDIALLEVINLL